MTVLVAGMLGARVSRREVAALGAMGVGLLLLAVAARPDLAKPLPRSGQWALLAGVVLVLLVGIVAGRDNRSIGVAGLAVGAGLGFAGVGVAARALVVPHSLWRLVDQPLVWAIVGYGLLASLLFATALQRGSVTTATALTFAVETVVPTAVGLALLGDRARPGFIPVAGSGSCSP